MELAFTFPEWKELLIVILTSIVLSIGSFFLIRLAGKKSISQTTLPQMVIMVSMGSLITKPLNDEKTIIGTLIAIFVFVMVMLFLEYISLKSDKIEPILDSKPTLLIVDGKIQTENLRDLRMTVDQLESMIRQKGISSIKELRTCTLEIDGKMGYEKIKNNSASNSNLFDELRKGKHDKFIDPKLD